MATETKRKDRPDVLAGDKYFNLIEHAADGIAIIQDGVFKLVNTALTRISGYDKEELLGMLFTELLTPASQKLTLERYQARLAGKKVPQIYEVQAVTKDGQIRDIELNAALTEYDGRAADEVIARDITERKKIENKIKKTEQEKTDILNSMSEIVIFQDLEHRMLWVNKIASESAGLTHEQMLGRYCYEVWSQRNQSCVGCPVQKARQTGKPQKAEIATPDGRLWSISGYPMRDENGVITGMLEVALDITERKKAEQELQTERNKLQSVIGAIEYALTIQDKDYNIMYQNEASRISSSGSRIGEKCYRVYEGRDKVCDGCPVKKAFKDGKSHTAERQRLSSSGEITFWENTANPITDASGKIVSCLEIGRNITDRKKAEQALADETTRRRILIDQSRDGIVILDQNGKVYEANQQFAEMLGYTPEETAKLHVWDWEYLHPREQVMEMLRTVDEAGDHFETQHRRKDGSVYDVEISTNGTMFAGQKLIFCVCRDITERKKAEEKLQTIIKTALDGFWLTNLEGKILEVNDSYCKMTSYTRVELLNMSISDLEAIESPEETIKHIKNVIEKGYDSFESRHKRKDGQIIDVEVSVNYLDVGQGQLFVFARDITERKKAEQALRESEEKLERMFESVSNGISVVDLNSVITEVNQRTVEMHGFSSKDELVGKSASDLVAPQDRKKITANMREAVKRGVIRDVEYTLLKADGSEFPAELSTSALKDASGKVIGHITVSRDITERKRAEEKLNESEERFRIASQIASDVVYERDLQTGIATFYGDIDSHFGYEPGEYPRTMEGWREHVHPEDLAWIDSQSIDQMEPGVPHSIEYRMRKKDGTYMTWLDKVTVICDEKTGKPLKFLGAATDITERKQAEQALQAEKNKLQSVIDAMEDDLSIQDKYHNITYQNKPSKTNFGDHLGEKCYRAFEGRDEVDEDCPVEKAFKDGKSHISERKLVTLSGEVIYLENTANPIKDASGKIVSCLEIGRDVTERKRAAEREKELQKELLLSSRLASIGELAAGVAHQINNPLTGVLGFSQRLLKKSTDQATEQDLNRIYTEAERAAKVVQNLLTFARRRQPLKQYSDINEILESALELRAYELKTSNIEVVTDLDPKLPEIMLDFYQIQEVFLNIILNAEQALTEAHNGGKLTILTVERRGYVRTTFTDDGLGIPAERLDNIFDPFYTTKAEKGGTGLGLSVCHGIITEHGGKIYAKSKPGKGATFFVELPLTPN
jgi:PAS domain S-box-containing protein